MGVAGTPSSLQGHLLIAAPDLPDPNFSRTVVLLVQHSEEAGALGLVLNRPSQNTLREIWDKLGEGPCPTELILDLGGPVVGPLMALHQQSDLSELEIVPGVHFSSQRENLKPLALREPPVRFFLGYSGWAGGQLEAELETGSWLTVLARPEYLFAVEGDLWRIVTRDLGSDTLKAFYPSLPSVPPDPRMN